MSTQNKPKVYALNVETEYDFMRKSGSNIDLVFVFKSSGGYDIYHPGSVPHIIEKLSDGKIALHKGIERTAEAKAKFDSQLNEITWNKTNTVLRNIGTNTDDTELTEVKITSQAELGIDFNDTMTEIDTITYAKLSTFSCCIPEFNFYCP